MGMFVPRERRLWLKKVYNATLTRWMAKRAAAIVATSELEAQELAELARSTRVVIRPNGVDLSQFKNLSGGEKMRKRWAAEPFQTVIGYFGRISSKKNLHGLIDAFAKADIANAKLVIAGPVSERDYNDKLVQQIDSCPRRNDIRLEGPFYGEELKAAWSAIDLFVLPSFNENFGNAAGEAVAANVPVLVTNTCGVAAMIDQRAGLAVSPNVDELAAGLRRLADRREKERLTAAIDVVKGELSLDGPVDQSLQMYRDILSATGFNQSA